MAQPWNRTTIDQATAALEQGFTPLTDVRASKHYRMQVAKNRLYKCYLEREKPDANTSVVHYFQPAC